MSQIDNVLGFDWGDETTRYIGDGVYAKDCTTYSGVPAIAIRTDRTDETGIQRHFVIVLEQEFFNELKRVGDEIIDSWRNKG